VTSYRPPRRAAPAAPRALPLAASPRTPACGGASRWSHESRSGYPFRR